MRPVLLPTHIVSAVGLIGADLALAVLGVRGMAGAPAAEIYPAMSVIVTVVMIPLGAVALASGLTLTRVTGIGLRPGWVRTKLAITLLLTAVLIGFLAPGLAAVAADATATHGLASPPPQYAVGPVVSATLLVLNVLLAVRRPTRRPLPSRRTTKDLTRAAS